MRNKAVWIGGIVGLLYSLISFFFTYAYNLDGTPLDFLMPVVSVWFLLSYLQGVIIATIIFVLIGALIGFIIGNYKEVGFAILIGILLSFIALYILGIFLKDTAPIVWIAPLIIILSLLIGFIIRKKTKIKGGG